MSPKKYLSIFVVVSFMALSWGTGLAWTPNDPNWSQQWHLQAIGMESAWDYNQGGSSEVTIAILDTGLNWGDADFAQTNVVAGYDFVEGDNDPYDEDGHGTHVAGTIAQSTDNGVGSAGIAFNCTIMPVRVLDENGSGAYEDIIAGIYYAIDAGVDIINLSLGGNDTTDGLRAACDAAYEAGIFISAASGNDYPDLIDPLYPAMYSSTTAVAAVNRSLSSAYYSQSAVDENGYSISAPGNDILQTVNGGDMWSTGTSMATPQISAVAALILSEAMDLGFTTGESSYSIPEKSSARVDWLRSILFDTAEDVGSSGLDMWTGYGMVRADLALAYLNTLADDPGTEPEEPVYVELIKMNP